MAVSCIVDARESGSIRFDEVLALRPFFAKTACCPISHSRASK